MDMCNDDGELDTEIWSECDSETFCETESDPNDEFNPNNWDFPYERWSYSTAPCHSTRFTFAVTTESEDLGSRLLVELEDQCSNVFDCRIDANGKVQILIGGEHELIQFALGLTHMIERLGEAL